MFSANIFYSYTPVVNELRLKQLDQCKVGKLLNRKKPLPAKCPKANADYFAVTVVTLEQYHSVTRKL